MPYDTKQALQALAGLVRAAVHEAKPAQASRKHGLRAGWKRTAYLSSFLGELKINYWGWLGVIAPQKG